MTKGPLWHGPDRRKDYTAETLELFSRFADRHRLAFSVLDAPVEVLWEFPVQERLTHRVTLGLQNNDELNFGVPGFWSYFFPFPSVHGRFEEALDAWIEGRARIVNRGYWSGRVLEIAREGGWDTLYTAYTMMRWGHAAKVIRNGSAGPGGQGARWAGLRLGAVPNTSPGPCRSRDAP